MPCSTQYSFFKKRLSNRLSGRVFCLDVECTRPECPASECWVDGLLKQNSERSVFPLRSFLKAPCAGEILTIRHTVVCIYGAGGHLHDARCEMSLSFDLEHVLLVTVPCLQENRRAIDNGPFEELARIDEASKKTERPKNHPRSGAAVSERLETSRTMPIPSSASHFQPPPVRPSSRPSTSTHRNWHGDERVVWAR